MSGLRLKQESGAGQVAALHRSEVQHKAFAVRLARGTHGGKPQSCRAFCVEQARESERHRVLFFSSLHRGPIVYHYVSLNGYLTLCGISAQANR